VKKAAETSWNSEAMRAVFAWCRVYAPDLRPEAVVNLYDSIGQLLIDERNRCCKAIRTALASDSDRDFEWGKKLLAEVRGLGKKS
jgi:hypothetical protein